MSGPPRLRSTNIADSAEDRPVLGPAGNKARPTDAGRKPASKKPENPPQEPEKKKALANSPSPQCAKVPSILRRQQQHHHRHSLMNASFSSEASSSDSSLSPHSGRAARRGVAPLRRKQCGVLKAEKAESDRAPVSKMGTADSEDCLDFKKRCAWITPNTDQCYIAFHDDEWGVPVHDDKKLFELLSLSGALAELTWPAILNKRHIFREVFLDFDPVAVSKLNEKKITSPGSLASSLLSELKLRAMIENARQMCKVIEEFGSFEKYIWSFVNHKPIVSQFRYPRQVPVKTPKAEVISKDLVRRGFRSVGPTVVYTFMQVAGLTNDHLISCFRFPECTATAEAGERDGEIKCKIDAKISSEPTDFRGLARAVGELVFISK
ncbi:Methyladenine glycosylase [Trema orientale]|uniref:Methyladenine glycosylase n=1 Tax=Trema orientale TaxID=63057 RepID=A0A2P5EUT3_TREOI|nr:Methyladenine glycosylase [Trema orientale]